MPLIAADAVLTESEGSKYVPVGRVSRHRNFSRGFQRRNCRIFYPAGVANGQANFDWLLNENNMVKVLEGNYDNRDPTPKRSPSSHLTVAYIRKQRGGGAGADKPTAQGP